MYNTKEFKAQKQAIVRKGSDGTVVKRLNKRLTNQANKIASLLQEEYSDYYYLEGLRDTFNGEYAYMYKDIMGSGNLIEIKPCEFKNRREILKKNGKKGAFYIGFIVPWYE